MSNKDVFKKVAGGLFSAYALYRLYLIIKTLRYNMGHVNFGFLITVVSLAGFVVLAAGCFVKQDKLVLTGTCMIALCDCYYFLRAMINELRHSLRYANWLYLLYELCLAAAFVLLAIFLFGKAREKAVGISGGAVYLLGVLSYAASFKNFLIALVVAGGIILLTLAYSKDVEEKAAERLQWREQEENKDGVISDAVLKKLVELKKLADMDVLTQEEFNRKRDELLGRNKEEETAAGSESIYPEFSNMRNDEPKDKVWFQ